MSENGKGSARRGTSREERRRFEEGWEAIFGKAKRPRRRTKVESIKLSPSTAKLAKRYFDNPKRP